MKITTNNGTTIELSDSFNGEITVNGVSYKFTTSAVIPVSSVKESDRDFNVYFAWCKGCKKIDFIKFLRLEFNLGLGEAKEMSERGEKRSYCNYPYVTSTKKTGTIVCKDFDQFNRVRNQLRICGYEEL